MIYYEITIHDPPYPLFHNPFLVSEKPTEEELKKLLEVVGKGHPNNDVFKLQAKIKEVTINDTLSDKLTDLKWVMASSSASNEGDCSYYVKTDTGNTWTCDINQATLFNEIEVKIVAKGFENLGRSHYFTYKIKN